MANMSMNAPTNAPAMAIPRMAVGGRKRTTRQGVLAISRQRSRWAYNAFMEIVVALGVLAAIVLLWFSSRSAITLSVLEVRDGKVEVAKGSMSPRIVSDIQVVLRRPKVQRATIRVLRQREHAKVEVTGDLSPAQQQQLRNVVGSVPLAKLRNGPRRG